MSVLRKAEGSCLAFYDLVSEATQHHSCFTLLTETVTRKEYQRIFEHFLKLSQYYTVVIVTILVLSILAERPVIGIIGKRADREDNELS